MMKPIGGYFELELRQGEHYHKDAIRLNSARNCFEYILLARKYKKVFLPYYTCEVLLQPLHKYGLAYEFYSINKFLEPVCLRSLCPDEAFLYTNYFGLKQAFVRKLSEIYGEHLIVDNAQAFFAPRIESIDTFYSPRKFFGVPDGGYLYTNCLLTQDLLLDHSYDRIQHLVQRIDNGAEDGYAEFRRNDESLDNRPLFRMSKLTSCILQNIDYEEIKEKRCSNFNILQEYLGCSNHIDLKLQEEDIPMVYPYYTTDIMLKNKLIKNKIFVATYWPNVCKWCASTGLESHLVKHLLPLPIDQRYGFKEMDRIIKQIKE